MGCVKRIVVIGQIQVEGSNGTKVWFIPFKQYCFEEIVDYEIGCDCHAVTGTRQSYYRIVINDEDFLLPTSFAAYDMRDLPAQFQDLRLWYNNKHEQPADMWKEFKKYTGIDIEKGNTVVNNGYDLYKKIQGASSEEVGTDSQK
jgi:hypothetical protein